MYSAPNNVSLQIYTVQLMHQNQINTTLLISKCKGCVQKMLNDNTKRKLAEAVRHRWPEFSIETPQESSCATTEMRFLCALICSAEDKEQLCAADLGMKMCQKKVQNLFLLPIMSKQFERFNIYISFYALLKEERKKKQPTTLHLFIKRPW